MSTKRYILRKYFLRFILEKIKFDSKWLNNSIDKGYNEDYNTLVCEVILYQSELKLCELAGE